jgi:hypothetical protein
MKNAGGGGDDANFALGLLMNVIYLFLVTMAAIWQQKSMSGEYPVGQNLQY